MKSQLSGALKSLGIWSLIEKSGPYKRYRERDSANFANHYVKWRKKRIKAIVRHYGADWFKGKSLLELGCGYGDIGAAFAELGANVTCSDGRQEHLTVINQRHPRLRTVQADLDSQWPFEEKYDVILHLGVLYHLKLPDASLAHACKSAEHLVLETEVCDSDDPLKIVTVPENPGSYDQALNSFGCRPSEAYVERILAEQGMQFERIQDARCNSGYHRYDWPVQNTGKCENGLRRFWFVRRGSAH